MTRSAGDLDHRCRRWNPAARAGEIADAAGEFWRCRGVELSAPNRDATESWLTAYRALLASHLSSCHSLGVVEIGLRLKMAAADIARLLELSMAPLPDPLRALSNSTTGKRTLAVLARITSIPMATPVGERLLATLAAGPDRAYQDLELVADVIAASPDEFRHMRHSADMKGFLYRQAGRDVTMPLKLTDTASRTLRQLDASGLVGGIDGTRLPFQQPRYNPKQKRWLCRTIWQHVVVGVAGKPPVIVAIEVGRETDEVVQQVVHAMATAGVRPPLVLCHDGLATYRGDPFLLSCLTYGYEPREVNFPWENPAEAAINELKSRWPAKCSEEHFGSAGEEAVREIQDPVRGSSFTPHLGRVAFSDTRLFLANFRDLAPARVKDGAAYHGHVRIPVPDLPDGSPILTGLRFDQPEDRHLQQCVEAHALLIELHGPSGTRQDWTIAMGITGAESVGFTPLLNSGKQMRHLDVSAHPDFLPLPGLIPTSLAGRLDVQFKRAVQRRGEADQADYATRKAEDKSGPPGGPSSDVRADGTGPLLPTVCQADQLLPWEMGSTSELDRHLGASVRPTWLGAEPTAALAPHVAEAGPAATGMSSAGQARRQAHAGAANSDLGTRLAPLQSVVRAVAEAPFVTALHRWVDHPDLRVAATTRGIAAGSRSVSVVSTGHSREARRTHTIISAATFQQVACQPLSSGPSPIRPAETGSLAVSRLRQCVDSIILHLKGAEGTPSSHPSAPCLKEALNDAEVAAGTLCELHCGRAHGFFDWDGVADDLKIVDELLGAGRPSLALKVLTPLRARLPRH